MASAQEGCAAVQLLLALYVDLHQATVCTAAAATLSFSYSTRLQVALPNTTTTQHDFTLRHRLPRPLDTTPARTANTPMTKTSRN
jgi:hypothetical protein